MGPFDVLCLQEVAINFAEMDGGETVDQIAEIAARCLATRHSTRRRSNFWGGAGKGRNSAT